MKYPYDGVSTEYPFWIVRFRDTYTDDSPRATAWPDAQSI